MGTGSLDETFWVKREAEIRAVARKKSGLKKRFLLSFLNK